MRSPLYLLFLLSSASLPAANVLLNGAVSTSTPGFVNFLDDTRITVAGGAPQPTAAWAFPKSLSHVLITGGDLSSVALTPVGGTGGAGLTISNSENGGTPRTFDLNGYNWSYGYAGADIAARNELANDGGGVWSNGGQLTLQVAPTIAIPNQDYHVEILAVASGNRSMSASANGTTFATNWNTTGGIGAGEWNSVLEFDTRADASGLQIILGGGTEFGDINPYIHALSITAVPEPSRVLFLALGSLALFGRRRR